MTEEKTGMRPVVYVSKAPAVTEGLTVKEALAQRFTNYKVRLPRRSGTELIERRWSAKRPRAEFNIEDMLNYNEESQSPPASDLEALPNYELQPFWFYDVESGRSRWNNVNGIKYSFFNGLFSSKDSIMVPMKKRVPFRINGKIVQLSLYELLYHNGIVVKDDKRMKELKDVFSIVNLMVHYRIFATFLNVDGSTEMATEENPIEISPLHPPFVAFRPALWHQFLNTRQGVNRICDENYKYQCLIPSFSNLPSKELSPLEQLLAIVQIDTECLPEAVANNFGVSENLIDSILLTKQKVLRNMTRILVERTFENESSGKTTEQQENAAKLSPKVRRSTYGLNAIVWCLFKECATRGIKLNGKLVKKYALWIGHQIGLPDFKASEGWLDKLKKRHNMDFNEMTGEPGTYDDEDGDPKLELEAIRDDLMTKYEHVDNVCDGDQEAEATGSITIKSTGPLDLGPLDLFSGLIKAEPLDETDEPTASASQNGEEPAFLESLLRSVSTHIPNVELAYAVDLIRSYLVANDPGTLPLLAELQSRLAATVQASGETPYSK